MSKDPYKLLGLERTATPDEIQAAFRKLAKRFHPDLNPGNKAAEDTFKQITAAYELLSDPKQRARFDRGEIDAAGQPRPDRQFEWAFEGGRPGGTGPDFEDLGDIFSEFFGGYRTAREKQTRSEGEARAGRGPKGAGIRGADVQYTMEAEFLDAANGARRRVTMHDGRALDIQIPKGLKDGQTLRLKGQGLAGALGGEPGDALVEVKVRAHPYFKREGDDIRLELPVSLREAVEGAIIEVPTLTGPVSVTVPAGSNTGRVLRLKGKGFAGAGDQLVTLKVMLPKTIDRELQAFLSRWTYADYNPRKG